MSHRICWRSDVPGRNCRIRSNVNIAQFLWNHPSLYKINHDQVSLMRYDICCQEMTLKCSLIVSFPSFPPPYILVVPFPLVPINSPRPDTFPYLFLPVAILSFPSTPFPFHASPLSSFPHFFLSMLHPLIPFPPFFLSVLCPIIPFLPFISLMKRYPQKMFVVVCFGSLSDLADLQTEAVLLTVASNGLIHVTGGLCLSSSSFEMRHSSH